MLARGRGHAIYAKHGTGKSLFSLWIATGLVRAGHVVIYADFEMGEDDLYERLTDMGIDEPEPLERLRYLILPSLPPLDSPAGALALCALVDEVEPTFPGRHLVVVIDTIGRAVVGEENSNDTVHAFYRHTGLALKQRGLTWVRLDHAGHEAAHARGASAKGDDVDVVWRLTRTEAGIELAADKRRMSWVPERVVFRIVEDPLLRFERAAGAWPAGTYETAALLEHLGVDVEAAVSAAQGALKAAGHGRRKAVVVAAQRCRRGVGNRSGIALAEEAGNRPRNRFADTPENAHDNGAEPMREPPGTDARGNSGTAGRPSRREGPGSHAPPAEVGERRCPVCEQRLERTRPGEPICQCSGVES